MASSSSARPKRKCTTKAVTYTFEAHISDEDEVQDDEKDEGFAYDPTREDRAQDDEMLEDVDNEGDASEEESEFGEDEEDIISEDEEDSGDKSAPGGAWEQAGGSSFKALRDEGV